MALPLQKFREIVFQILFSSEFGTEGVLDTALMLMKELQVTKRAVLDACARSSEILAKLAEIDEKIRRASKEYQLERISFVEKCALRLGLFDLLYDPLLSLSPKIAISEAIRLTRKFGTPESASFVNAILDAVYKDGLLASQPAP